MIRVNDIQNCDAQITNRLYKYEAENSIVCSYMLTMKTIMLKFAALMSAF